MDLRIVALDIPPQDTITKDNVSLSVNAVVYFRVADPAKAVVEIEDYYFATSQLAQTTLRSVIGQSELDELLAEREQINEIVRQIIDEGTDPWGIDVTGVEIKDIDLPKEMKRAMAKQAEAERERRGKVIAAEGEYQASKKLALAANVIEKHPVAIQLRFMQTAVEIAAENNSTTVFPIPMELFGAIRKGPGTTDDRRRRSRPSKRVTRRISALPEGAETQLLAETAKSILGIGAGRRKKREEEEGPGPRRTERLRQLTPRVSAAVSLGSRRTVEDLSVPDHPEALPGEPLQGGGVVLQGVGSGPEMHDLRPEEGQLLLLGLDLSSEPGATPGESTHPRRGHSRPPAPEGSAGSAVSFLP